VNRLLILLIPALLFAQKKRFSDTEMMLIVLNNAHSRATISDSMLTVYVSKGKIDTLSLLECAEIAGVNTLVVLSKHGKYEAKTKTK